jgi:hypothetical protein
MDPTTPSGEPSAQALAGEAFLLPLNVLKAHSNLEWMAEIAIQRLDNRPMPPEPAQLEDPYEKALAADARQEFYITYVTQLALRAFLALRSFPQYASAVCEVVANETESDVSELIDATWNKRMRESITRKGLGQSLEEIEQAARLLKEGVRKKELPSREDLTFMEARLETAKRTLEILSPSPLKVEG